MTLSSRFFRAWMFFFAAWYGCSGQPHAGRDRFDASAADKDAAVVADVQALAAAPSVVTLNATADTYIAQATATQNFGTATQIDVTGVALSGWEAGLVQFDTTAIRNAVGTGTLQSASLRLAISSTALGIGGSQVTFNRMTSPWTEQGATWLCANDTDNSLLGKFINNCSSANSWGIEWWSFQPRPYLATATATVSVPFGATGSLSADVTQDVKAVLTGGSHYGWFVSSTAGLSSVWVRFSSRQGTTAPKLVLTFTPACVPTGADNNCDGIDNNCNGTIDEGYVRSNTTCGMGACARTGMTSCVNGMVLNSCVPGAPAASDTSCNGVDDNCNGSTDEGYVAHATQCGTGACARTGTSSCPSGTEQTGCIPGTPAATDTTCDNVDDNCNGVRDEGFVSAATSCTANGCRSTGTLQCVNHATVDSCTASPVCVAEANCTDGVDNDSDGKADCGDSDCHCLADHSVETLFGGTLTDYWDARAGVATSSGRVTAWLSVRDGTPLNAPANPANQPVFGADGTEFGSMPVVETSIASQAYLSGQLSATALPAGARPYIAVVHRSRALGTATASVLDATSPSAQARLNLYTEQTSAGSFFCPDSPTAPCQYLTSSAVQSLHPVISEVWLDTDGLHFAQDGIAQTTTSGSVTAQPLVRAIERLVVGALPDGSQLSDTSFAQIVVTSSVPNAELRAAYRKYARGAWVLHRCGDGFLDVGEQCDDGNTNDADACSNACVNTTTLATTPPQVLGSSVVEWWDARAGLGTAAGGVTAWQGQKNNTLLSPGLLATSTRPNYATDDDNFYGRAVVQTSIANNAFLSGSLGSSLLPVGAQPYIAIVHRTRAANTAKESIADIVSSDRSSTRLSLYTENTASSGVFCPDSPAVACQTYSDAASQKSSTILTELWIDSDGTHYAENGRESILSAPTSNQTLLRALELISVGANASKSQVSNSNFAQIVLASSRPSATQRAQYLQYTCSEWGLTGCSLDGFPPTGTTCNPADAHCGFGRECRNGVGVRFGLSASAYVCWDTGCDNYQSGVFGCGSHTSHCGTCPACTTNCAGKSCGSDGCFGTCGAKCTQGEQGCASSADCAAGLACVRGASGSNSCLPEMCAHPGLNPCSDPANAGLATACGVCPSCTPECTGRACGPAANGCGQCDSSTLGDSEYCTPSGVIATNALSGSISVPLLAPDGATTVGTIPGTFAVSDFGQATYRIPVQVPPGRNGIEPNLSLVYNSADGDGYLGVGWGLSGLSAIQRCPKTQAQDGVAASVTYTDADRFCLDGNRLVPANDDQVYGADRTFYRTEVDTFARIELFRSGASPEPERFEVRTADGQILSFDQRVGGRSPRASVVDGWDASPNASQVRTQTWLLTAVRDRFGNTMRISYTAPAAQVSGSGYNADSELTAPSDALEQLPNGLVREYYPSRIEYTSNGGTEADRTLDFGYRVRPVLLSGYNAGVRYERSRLLQRIVASVQGRTMFTYTLRYDDPSDGATDGQPRSRLTSVEQCARAAVSGSRDLVCMPRTRFEYTETASGFGAPSQQNGLPTQGITIVGKPLVLDLDGDGRDDVLTTDCPDERPACHSIVWGYMLNDGQYHETSVARQFRSNGDTRALFNVFVVDYDLDGKDDVIEIDARAHDKFYVTSFASGELERSEGQDTLTHAGSAPYWDSSNAYILDANGDGGPDLVACTPVPVPGLEQRLSYLWERRLYDASARRFSDTVSVVTDNGPPCDDAAAVDIDGDGAQELLLNVAPAANPDSDLGTDTFVVPAQPRRFGVLWPMLGMISTTVLPAASDDEVRLTLDVNGDGLVDIVDFATSGHALKVQVWTNTGAGFVSGQQSIGLANSPCPNLDQGQYFENLQQSAVAIDENTDGRGDLVFQCGDAQWAVLRSAGDRFDMIALDTGGAGVGSTRLFAYDANNDGMADLATLGLTYIHSGAPFERLVAVTNGLGARTSVVYAGLAAPDDSDLNAPLPLYQQTALSEGCGYPVSCRHPRSTVVRAHRVWDHEFVADVDSESSPTNTYWYRYGGAARDLLGRGDLGFGTRSIVDQLRNTAAAAFNGTQRTDLEYENLIRDDVTGLYPCVGRASVESDQVMVADGRFRQSGFSRKLTKPTGEPNLVILHPTPHSMFAYYSSEYDLVLEEEPQAQFILKNVEYAREYDTLGRLTSYAELWADAFDGKAQDDVTITTDYQPSIDYLNEWLIRSPTRTVVTMRGERSSTRVQTFGYAPGAGDSLTGRPETVVDQPDDSAHSLTHRVDYDAYGNVESSTLSGTTIDGEQARTTSVVYDDFHMFPVLVTQPDGHQVHVDYDQGLGVAVASYEEGRPNEFVTRAETPDGFGRMRRVIAADGSTVTINYQARMETGTGGLRIETARAGAPKEIAELDVLGRSVHEEVDGFQDSLVTNINYGPTGFGKPTGISRAHIRGLSDSDAEVTKVEYDPLGRITSLKLPDSTTMARCYRKNAVCTNDQVGLTSCTVYDEHGRAAHRVEPAATAAPSNCESKSIDISDRFPSEADASSPDRASYVTKRFHYHPSGDVLSILDAADHETRFERDARGNVTTVSSADNGSWVRQYNAFNEIEHEISPTSADTVFQYDVLGRLNRRTDIGSGQAGADEVTTFAFDVDQGTGFHGKPVAADTPDGVHTAFGYDAFGRLTTLAKTIPAGGGAQTLTRHTSYDQYGRPDQVSYDAAGSGPALSYRYGYTPFGYLLKISRPNANDPNDSSQDTAVWSAGAADAYGQIISEGFANGIQTHRSYEASTGRLQTLTSALGATEVQHLEHAYYNDGTLHTRTDLALATPSVQVYDYDSLKRLKALTTHAGTAVGAVLSEEGYGYDADHAGDGNLSQRSWSDASTGQTRSWTLSYDAAKPHAVSHVSDGTSEANLAYWSDGSLHSRTGSLQLALSVENDGRHNPRTITSAAGPVTFTYDAVGTRVRKATAASEVLYLDEHYSRQRVAATSGFEEHLLISGGGRALAEVVRSPSGTESTSYLHTDHLGSVDVVTTQTGAVAQRRDYEAFGARRAGTASTSEPLRADFTGHELDAELGLINMKARLYDPQLGRFLASDPIVANPLGTQGSNPYSYVENNPANLIDPFGLCGTDPTGQMSNVDSACQDSNPFTVAVDGIKKLGKQIFGGGKSSSPAGSGRAPIVVPKYVVVSAPSFDARSEVSSTVASVRYAAEVTTDFAAGALNTFNPLSLVGYNITSVFGHEDAYSVGEVAGIAVGLFNIAKLTGTLLGQGVRLALESEQLAFKVTGPGVNLASAAEETTVEFMNFAKSLEGGTLAEVGGSASTGAADATQAWKLGEFKSAAKWESQLAKRGWTPQQITAAIEKGERFAAENLVNKGNAATRYVHPETGQSVVLDEVTKEVIHVGGPGFKY